MKRFLTRLRLDYYFRQVDKCLRKSQETYEPGAALYWRSRHTDALRNLQVAKEDWLELDAKRYDAIERGEPLSFVDWSIICGGIAIVVIAILSGFSK